MIKLVMWVVEVSTYTKNDSNGLHRQNEEPYANSSGSNMHRHKMHSDDNSTYSFDGIHTETPTHMMKTAESESDLVTTMTERWCGSEMEIDMLSLPYMK